MTTVPAHHSETYALKLLIQDFLAERLQAKLDALSEKNEERRLDLLKDYAPQTWTNSAAGRAKQIQIVNFGLKFTHPDARGSSIYLEKGIAAPTLLGTHSLGEQRQDDVVGNAAALDVYKLLRLSHNGRSLLQRAKERDSALLQALSDDPEQAEEWAAAFAAIIESKGPPSSHQRAKQVYFPLADGGYHLLSPLYPTSLVHRVHQRIQSDRFSEEAQSARKAMHEGQASDRGFCEYSDLAIQKFGGSKPQNISQLNSERRGEAYLLPSIPPTWQPQPDPPPKRVNSVFSGRFGRRRRVYELTKTLRNFLARTDYNNIDIRDTRRELIARICDEALQFATEVHQMTSGWSGEDDCKLDRPEQLWLDPQRALDDEAAPQHLLHIRTDPQRARDDENFAKEWHQGDWRDEICSRFGKWLNGAISSEKKIMGDPEYREWASELSEEIRLLRLELDHA